MRRAAVATPALLALAAIVAVLFVPSLEVRREQSPDGEFLMVTRDQLIYALVPMMPGRGGDKPVYVTVYKGGQSCGTARAEPGWIARDEFAWELDAKPRRARIKLVAEWDLDACTMTK